MTQLTQYLRGDDIKCVYWMQSQMAILTVPQTYIDHIHIRFTCKEYLLMMVFGCEQTKCYKCTFMQPFVGVCVAQNQTHNWNNHKIELQAKAFSNSCVDHKHWEYPMVIQCLNSICNNDNNQCARVCICICVCLAPYKYAASNNSWLQSNDSKYFDCQTIGGI